MGIDKRPTTLLFTASLKNRVNFYTVFYTYYILLTYFKAL